MPRARKPFPLPHSLSNTRPLAIRFSPAGPIYTSSLPTKGNLSSQAAGKKHITSAPRNLLPSPRPKTKGKLVTPEPIPTPHNRMLPTQGEKEHHIAITPHLTFTTKFDPSSLHCYDNSHSLQYRNTPKRPARRYREREHT